MVTQVKKLNSVKTARVAAGEPCRTIPFRAKAADFPTYQVFL
ncbi:MAG: hypothetical protein NWQ43_16835 [Dolichospermum sp.]|nr:hypothetical protein [Anabaena sp. UHCC 0187]MDP5018940.1 hypothetical protein [Dolichospermum sp.]